MAQSASQYIRITPPTSALSPSLFPVMTVTCQPALKATRPIARRLIGRPFFGNVAPYLQRFVFFA